MLAAAAAAVAPLEVWTAAASQTLQTTALVYGMPTRNIPGRYSSTLTL